MYIKMMGVMAEPSIALNVPTMKMLLGLKRFRPVVEGACSAHGAGTSTDRKADRSAVSSRGRWWVTA
jgi:hypothetical protein